MQYIYTPKKYIQNKFDFGIYTQYIYLKMKRGMVSKSRARLINIWLPLELVPEIDRAIQVEDSDRSKFIRNAIREKISRVNFAKTPEAA
jgi:hypothetical protein